MYNLIFRHHVCKHPACLTENYKRKLWCSTTLGMSAAGTQHGGNCPEAQSTEYFWLLHIPGNLLPDSLSCRPKAFIRTVSKLQSAVQSQVLCPGLTFLLLQSATTLAGAKTSTHSTVSYQNSKAGCYRCTYSIYISIMRTVFNKSWMHAHWNKNQEKLNSRKICSITCKRTKPLQSTKLYFKTTATKKETECVS